MLVKVANNTVLTNFNIKGKTDIIKDFNTFLEDVALELIAPQEILVDDLTSEEKNILEECNFKVIFLNNYRNNLDNKAIDNTAVDATKSEVAITLDKIELEKEQEDKNTDLAQLEPILNIATDNPNSLEKTKLFKVESIEKVSKKRKSFLHNILSKKQQTEELEVGIQTVRISKRLENDLSRGAVFRKYIIENKYLTVEQINTIDENIESNMRLGHKRHLIETARNLHLLTETQCAVLLSYSIKKEVISKSDLNLTEIQILNNNFLSVLRNFFIYKVNDELKNVYICKDTSTNPNTHILEQYYTNYHVIELNVVEGVTEEIIIELKK